MGFFLAGWSDFEHGGRFPGGRKQTMSLLLRPGLRSLRMSLPSQMTGPSRSRASPDSRGGEVDSSLGTCPDGGGKTYWEPSLDTSYPTHLTCPVATVGLMQGRAVLGCTGRPGLREPPAAGWLLVCSPELFTPLPLRACNYLEGFIYVINLNQFFTLSSFK